MTRSGDHLFFRLAIAIVFALLSAASGAPCRALDDDAAVDAAREGLAGPAQFPWYDEQADDVRRIDVEPPPPPPKAGQWEWDAATSTPRPKTRSSAWDLILKGLLYLAYGVIIALLVAAILMLLRAFLRNEAGASLSQQDASIGTDDDVDRVEALPFQVRRPKGDLLTEAHRHYEAGNFNEAIIYFYSYLLVELDKSQCIRLTRGKTNRQYLREIRRQPLLRELLEMAMIAFEDVFFGHHALDRDRFEKCYGRLDEFEARLQEAMA